jgi:hypothetical protein
MAKLTLRQQADALLERFGPEIADAYRASIDDITSTVTLRVVIDRLRAGDLDGVIAALNLDRAAFNPLELAIHTAYNAGGNAAVGAMPSIAGEAGRIVFRFDMRNAQAEAWVRDHSSTLVTNIIADQRTGIRSALEAGLSLGQNPTSTARDIVGRVNAVTGKREGGVIGLTSPQIKVGNNLRDHILSGDARRMNEVLASNERGKRFDVRLNKAIQAAADAGKPVSQDVAAKVLTSYNNKALKRRGDTIGLNETFTAQTASKHEAWRQSVAGGKIAESAVKRTWRHFDNAHPRIRHEEMDNVSIGLNQSYTLPNGVIMRFPHDPTAPASETIGCHCQEDYTIDYFGRTRARA